jgi:hypothetical protein
MLILLGVFGGCLSRIDKPSWSNSALCTLWLRQTAMFVGSFCAVVRTCMYTNHWSDLPRTEIQNGYDHGLNLGEGRYGGASNCLRRAVAERERREGGPRLELSDIPILHLR